MVIRIKAVALNFRDLAIASGHYHVATRPPLVPLSDGAGEVVAIGKEVTRVEMGDLVCPTFLPDWIDGPGSPEQIRRRLGGPSDGVMAEFVCVNEQAVVRAPSHLDATEAATLPVTAVTAWHSLFVRGRINPGETVVVLGTGGASTAAIQFAEASGARVISVTRKETQKEKLRSLGAADVIEGPEADSWPARVLELTRGLGADVVVDVVGAHSVGLSISATRFGGMVHLLGYAGGEKATIDIFDTIRHGVTIQAATAGSRRSFEALISLLERKKIRPPIDRIFNISDFREAFSHLANRGPVGKVVMVF